MLVAKFPGSIYAIEATTAGPANASAVRNPLRRPASTCCVVTRVRSVSDAERRIVSVIAGVVMAGAVRSNYIKM